MRPSCAQDIEGELSQDSEVLGPVVASVSTTSEIAARAGVTERTFFRHFPDKREVLFDGKAKLRSALVTAIERAPDALGPLETLLTAFRSTEKMIEANRPFVEPRHHVIAATPALQERELAKMVSLTLALASGLRNRGVDQRLATLAAQTGMAAFGQATLHWLEDRRLASETIWI